MNTQPDSDAAEATLAPHGENDARPVVTGEASSLFESAAVGVLHTDTNGRIINVNQAFCEMVGYAKAELTGRLHSDFVHPDFKGPPADFQRLIKGEIPHYRREKVYLCKDGTPLWTSITVSLQRGNPAARQHTVNVVQDISEQKHAEEALRASEERYRLLTEAGPHMTWTKLPDMSIEFVSKSWEQFTGLTFAEAKAQGWPSLVHPDDLPRVNEKVAGPIERGEQHDVVLRLRRHDGEYRWVVARAIPVRDENGLVVRWIGTSTDVHDHQRAEMRLAAEHAVSRVLAISKSLDEAAPLILDALCSSLEADVCELWLPQDDGQHMRCVAVHARESFEERDGWIEKVRSMQMKPGEMQAGVAWVSKAPVWSPGNLTANPPRARRNLMGGVAFPLMAGDRPLGVMCLHTGERITEDALLRETLASLGRAIGQFMLREQTERALVESGRRFRVAASAGGIGVWDFDIATGLATWSDEQERIFGLQPGTFGGASDDFISMVHPEDQGKVIHMLEAPLRGETAHEIEYRIVRPNGEVRWVYCHGTAELGPAAEPVRMFGVVTDITERKRWEESQKFLSEASAILISSLDYSETLRRVAELAVPALADWCVMSLLEPDGSLQQVAVARHGRDSAQAGGTTSHNTPDTSQALQQVAETGEPVLIPHFTPGTPAFKTGADNGSAPSGDFAPRSVIVVPLAGGDGVHGALTLISAESGRVYDSSDLATAKDLGYRCGVAISNARLYSTLEYSEQRFRETFENAAAGISHVSLDGSFLRVNQKICDILGYSRDELLNKTFQEVTHSEDLGKELVHIRSMLDGETDSFTMEKRFIRKDGSPVWVSKEGSVVRHADGSPDYLIAVVIDISQMKELEESLKQSNSTLERRVQERTAELEAYTTSLRLLAARLTQAEQSERKRLAEMIHDDLQQLLVAARMQVTSSRVATQDAPAAAARNLAVSLLDQAIEEARSLTAQLRPPALYESGLVSSLGWLAGWMEKAHTFRVELALEASVDPLAEEDAVLLFDVARELLLNAVKYSGVDRASVSLSKPDSGHVLLSVSDSGQGFDVSSLSSPQMGRGGFGLFSIRERVAAAGGRFEVRSRPGEGATIQLLWPKTEAIHTLDGAAPATDGVSSGRARFSASLAQPARPGEITIVLVEDHALVRQTLADALDRQPDLSVVAEATDGEQAIDAVDAYRPQVVVMDVNLPKLNGVQATRALKQRFPEVHVVGLTVHDDQATRQAMLDAGASACLSKDGPVEALMETIRRQTRLTSPI